MKNSEPFYEETIEKSNKSDDRHGIPDPFSNDLLLERLRQHAEYSRRLKKRREQLKAKHGPDWWRH